MHPVGQPAQEITQKLVAALAVVFMIRRAHHGGHFRHGYAEFLLGHDRHDIVRFQRERDTQLFQHRVVVHPTLQRQLWRGRIFAALIVNQAVQEARQNDVRAADKALFVFFGHPGVETADVDSMSDSARMRTMSLLFAFRV
jgi:hypothetical protein